MRILVFLFHLLSLSLLIAQPKPTSGEDRLNGFQQRKKLQEASLISELPFRNIGPTVFSGRVTDIDANPADPTQFYVAYASGGLWYTENNGASFTPLFDHEAAMTIGDIAVHWKDSIIWIGTGENNSSRSSYSGLGIFRSDDGGETWKHRGLSDSHHIGRIVLDSEDSQTLWVAVLGSLYSNNPERGVYKSIDGGNTWKRTLAVNENAGVVDLVADPSHPDRLYAATWERTRRAWNLTESGAGSGIYRSDDAGETWQLLTDIESGFPAGDGVGRIGLDVHGSGLVYAVVDNYTRRPVTDEPRKEALTTTSLKAMTREAFLNLEQDLITEFLDENGFPDRYSTDTIRQLIQAGTISPATLAEYLEDANALLFDTDVIGAEVYMSKDHGITWQRTHGDYLDDVFYSYGYYFGQIRVSPLDPKKLYILGVPILLSYDGGSTWKSIDAENVHGDHHALWLSPIDPHHLILGNDGGINVSYDDGRHYFKCNSPAVGQFYSVHTDRATPYFVYGGLQDNGVWCGPHEYEANTSWQSSGKYPYDFIYGGDGMQVQVDFRDNQTTYTGFQFGNYVRLDRKSGRSQRITPQHDLTERPYRWNWQTPIHLSRHHQDILYMGSNFVHRSLHRGDDFEKISPDLTLGGVPGDVPYGTLTTLHESPIEFGLLYAGSDDGLIHVTQDFGRTWKKISDALPDSLWISRVRASAHSAGRVYATLNGYRWDHFDAYVYLSEDFGETWTRIGLDLPAEPVNVILEDPVNPDLLYVGTDHGLYLSLDRGGSFQGVGETFPDVAVHDLDIQPVAKDLVIGTHGRSFYLVDLEQIQLMTRELLTKEFHLFSIPEDGMRVNETWGTRRAEWQEFYTPEITIPVYVRENTIVRLVVRKGDVTVHEEEFEMKTGLNFPTYDLRVDPTRITGYSKTVDPEAKRPEIAANGIMYLSRGEYRIVLALGKEEQQVNFTLK